MEQITATELKARIDGANATPFLLDVREQNEVDFCQIPGSHHMAIQSIPNRLADLPKDEVIVTICHHGMRSQQVAQFLLQNGFTDIINLHGGVHAWAADVDNTMPTY
ncbi:MAG: rhodanese-like domain-containing protein [Cycloclasticus sp.]